MKKLVILAAFAASLVTGSLRADPAARLAAFNKATGSGSNLLAITFGSAPGTMTNTLKELTAAGWTDDAVIATGNAQAILWAVKADGVPMTESFAGKLLTYVTANLIGTGPALAAQTMPAVPVSLRAPFRDAYMAYTTQPNAYPQPTRIALMVDKAMLMEGSLGSYLGNAGSLQIATVEELVALRLAPELRATDEATLILDKATVAAKKQLRKEGKSFVTYTEMTPVVTNIVGAVTNITGGAIVINPLANKLAPVVEAINAPLMIGIEDALATCGITITNQNAHRAAMSAVSDTWKNAVLDGDVAPAQQAPYLTALKVRLGIKDYNKFVDVYNNGAPK
jgi:hypothetical protein